MANTAGPPWALWPLGARIVVRRRLAEGGYSDTVGVLTARDEAQLTIETRKGVRTVATAAIAVGKVIDASPGESHTQTPSFPLR